MAAISGIGPAAAPTGAQAREQKGGRAATESGASPRESARSRNGKPDETKVRPGLLIDVRV